MSHGSNEGSNAAEPPVPSVLRLAWQLFMQPIKLHPMWEAWLGEKDPSLWQLRRALWKGEGQVRAVIGRVFLILMVCMPMLTIGICGLIDLVMPISWVGVAYGVAGGVAVGVAFGVALGVAYGVALGVAFGVAGGVALGVAVGVADVVTKGKPDKNTVDVAFGVAVGVAYGVAYGVAGGVAGGVAFGVAILRIHLLVLSSILTWTASNLAHRPQQSKTIAKYLPHRHFELLRFPLPGLDQLLIEIGTHHPTLGRQLIDEAATTLAQGKPARRALQELRARALERSVRSAETAGDWKRIIELDGPFFPLVSNLAPEDPLHAFIAAATDLRAALSGSQRKRFRSLESAAKHIDGLVTRTVNAGTTPETTRLLVAARTWSEVIAARLERLRHEIATNPEIPAVFVTGQPLDPGNPDERLLFRVRRDLITFIDQDLDEGRRGTLMLSGQRRMGKSSLLGMLPHHLGTATTIATCNFARLSGERGRLPHRRVVEALAAALSNVKDIELPPLDDLTDDWASALRWLERVDGELRRVDHRALVALDEVEGLQRAIEMGWGDIDFLEFVRAVGDSLTRIRLLLVSAHPLTSPRLPGWRSRLIPVKTRQLGPLPPSDAESLLRKPVPDFPDTVFDDERARVVLAETGNHPNWIQAVGLAVVNRLLEDDRKQASTRDVEEAVNPVVAEDVVLPELWELLTTDEQVVLYALAKGEAVDTESAAFRSLRDQYFIEEREGGAVFSFPLFGRWIRRSAPRPRHLRN